MILICEFLAPYNLHTRNVDFIYAPPQAVHLFHDGQFVGPFVYGRHDAAQHGQSEARLLRQHGRRADDPLLLPRRHLQVLGAGRGQLPSRLPGRGRAAVPARHRPARPRRAFAHHLWRAHLADHRPDRHHRQLHARHRHRRARRLSRRHLRPGRAAHHRGAAVAAEHSAVAGAGRDHAGHLEPDPRLFRHHPHPRPARLDGAGARRALEAAGAARGGLRARRAAHGREAAAASSAAI